MERKPSTYPTIHIRSLDHVPRRLTEIGWRRSRRTLHLSKRRATQVCLLNSLRSVQQRNKKWDLNKEIMDAYIAEIRKLENKFSGLEIHHVVRDNIVAAYVLSK